MKNKIDKKELSNWVKDYTKTLFAWALNKTSNYQLSEDLVQETFLVAAESIHSFRQESQPKTWLMSILRNKTADHYRKTLKQNITSSFSPEQINVFFY